MIKKVIKSTALFVLITAGLGSCGGGYYVQPGTDGGFTPAGNGNQTFVVVGTAPEFADAKNAAYAELMKQAITALIGESAYKANESVIARDYLPYVKAYKFVDEANRKWLSTGRDDSGTMVLKLQAPVKMGELKASLEAVGIKGAGSTETVKTTPTGGDTGTTGGKTDPGVSSVVNVADVDLTDVDLSSISFLVFYSTNGIAGNVEQQKWAQLAVNGINAELAKYNVTTFDLETVETLMEERNLMHESTAGTIGVGLLLAENVHAELYAECETMVNYLGTSAHVFLTIKVYVRTTGKLITTIEVGGREYDLVDLTTSVKASMRDAVQKSMGQFLSSLKTYVTGGRFYFVRLQKLKSAKDASTFSMKMKTIPTVKNVTVKSIAMDSGVADFYVQSQGTPSDLMDQIFSMMPDQPGFESFTLSEMRGNELIFSMR